MSLDFQDLHATLLNLALAESYKCVPSPGAFSVGSVIFLPRSPVTKQLDASGNSRTDGTEDASDPLDELYALLESFFPTLRLASTAELEQAAGRQEEPNIEVQGLILSASYSRALEGNTHAEANALTLLEQKISSLPAQLQHSVLAATGVQSEDPGASPGAVYQAILSRAWMYATMEPCSRRTSGLRSCTDAILASSLKRVYIVSNESFHAGRDSHGISDF
ncbi:hypothetical protein QFC19_002573 [Naganishia cerealis]|uniref:Uncharacterized protein n=1 Tax=Naganishia cerealis TaxID=610337 RepID=A0ACC2W9K7_9TREE|nr:hypothetical protein QFC19_002573 [Naganishia cerealis]